MITVHLKSCAISLASLLLLQFPECDTHFSLGGEVFWAGQHRKSGVGYAARYNTDKMVATGQVATTGVVLLLVYVQKVAEKVSLATDFMYNYLTKDLSQLASVMIHTSTVPTSGED
ncbi:Mitochondrial import receptor subunit TOM40-1 [Quillaja saponaria]|uniref:Mitochondrial import receptor subunit TOM40-1 n=1 Tax=Quillaja saponaria TaxID=32244 RepID=A0AAD7LBS3_QUISA|nr:Mitochondrial import receptor subunit TOM40-1 [Quillaja saponaria]